MANWLLLPVGGRGTGTGCAIAGAVGGPGGWSSSSATSPTEGCPEIDCAPAGALAGAADAGAGARANGGLLTLRRTFASVTWPRYNDR